MTPFVTMRRALNDTNLLGAALGGDSWLGWRVLLIAAMGEFLTDEERAIFTKLTGREREPRERVDELWCIIGRRGGKSRAIATLLVYLATMADYSVQLVSGESGVVLCLARTLEQAQVVLRYVAGIIDNAPILAKMVIRRDADSLTLSNRGATIEIAVRAASYRSIRGITCVAAVADEIAFWQADDGSANPDTEILRAIRPSLLTTRGPLIAISSPYARKGELWTTFKRDYGAQGDPRILVARAASREMNATLRQADIDREMDRDPASGLAEYYAEFRTDISAFVSQEVIDGCVAHSVFELPPAAGVSYLGFVDPSGGANDAMTLAIAHRVGDMVILDAVREIQPRFNPDAATTEFSALLRAYRVGKVIGDRYAGEWVREPFRRHGIEYQVSQAPKSDIYRDALPLFNAGRAQLLDLKRLVNQLCSLERRTARGGRDLIDHPQYPGAHDDLANAVCGAFVMLERDRRPQLISVSDVVGVDGLPTPLPRSECVFAAVWAVDADVAVVYGALSRWWRELFIADFDAVLYHGSFFADLATRLRELGTACGAPLYYVAAPRALIRHIEPHRVIVEEIPPWFDPAKTLLFAAACIKSGRVKFCPPTMDKMAIHPLGAALSFKADDPVDAALQGAFLAAISWKFDDQLSSKPKQRA
jgi:hypothetical protein